MIISVGKIFELSVENLKKVQDAKTNCDLDKDCGKDAFPARLYSGLENSILPKMCINGK